MLRLKPAMQGADAPGSSAVCGVGLRVLLCLFALAFGLLLLAPVSGRANPITDENALPGTTGWEVSQADTPDIDGYTDKTSVAPGETIGFRVSTKPSNISYRIVIYRLGWYSNGAGARQIACVPGCSGTGSTIAGATRTTPSPNAQTGEIDASNSDPNSWPQSASWTVPSTATTGEYVAEYVLTSGAQSGMARYSPFVVRSNAPQAAASRILVVVPFNTYNAYNVWGGTSAYDNTTSNGGPFPPSANDHATKVSFNRPFSRREWRFWDVPLLRFLEREGYDVSYVSDTDVDANPGILLNHRSVIVSGHSEYWTKAMRNGFDAARDAGTNIAFMGANDAYWQVRYEDSSCADDNTVCGTVGDRRTMVIYKGPNEGPNDPAPGTADDTSKFRELGRPECELQGGVQYGSYFPNDGYRNYATTAAGATDPWAAGTGLANGSTITGLVGFEYDSFDPTCNPPGIPTVLFQYQGPETSANLDAAAVRYTNPGSGARVFSSGTEQWAWGLDSYRWDPTLFTSIPPTNPAIQQFTRNMLNDMSRPAPPPGVTATKSTGNQIQVDTTGWTVDPRITSYKVYRHAGSGAFLPSDSGVTLACQNTSGDCTDTPSPQGTYRYASVAVDQWNDSSPVLSQAVNNFSPPTAVDDSPTVSEDVPGTAVPVLSNDTDPSGNPITISSASDPAHGTVVLTGGSPGANTGLTYQPDANYCNNPPGGSPDTFTYTVNGGSTATVSMTVTCVDDLPAAVHDTKSVVEDDPATAVDVLANDTDIDAGLREITAVTQPSHGVVTPTGGTTNHWTGLTYQPNANYCNFPGGAPSDDFTYTLNGGSSATASMTVDCVNDPPVANNDTATVLEDAAAAAVPVLSNDTDIEGDAITVASVTQPAHGAVIRNSDGSGLTYQPTANYCGPDDFTYTVNGNSPNKTATVSMTVSCVDDLPVAVHDSKSVVEDDPASAVGVLANDTDADGGAAASITSVTQPTHGQVVITGGGTGLTYKPDANYCNFPGGAPSDDFTYTLNGSSDPKQTATASMTVDCVNDPPVAHDDNPTVSEDASASSIDLLANDIDVDGDPITIFSKTDPAHGAAQITGGGTGLTYQPNANYCGPDSFTYTINGGSTATVSMTVTCVDDPPAAADDSKTVIEDDAAIAIDALANDSDIDGGPKEITAVNQPSHGVVTPTGGSTNHWTGLTYQPNANYCGPDGFTYTINGGSTATISITVDCSAPPVANDDHPVAIAQNAAATSVNVLSNDTDSDGGPMAINTVTQPAHGAVVINPLADGLTYKPHAGYCNTPSGPTDIFNYTLNGGSSATVFMTVACPAVVTSTPPQQTANTSPATTKCKKGFKKVKGKCKKKKKKRKRK